MRTRIVFAAIALLLLSSSASAQHRTLSFDPERSTVGFVLGATMHKVHGTLRMTEGRISFDTATGEASGEIVVDARSADTANKKRDRDMHNKVLESERFGTILFRPHRVEGRLPESGGTSMTVVGVIALHGSEHEISIPLAVEVDGQSLTVTAEFEVPYVDWGLRDPSKLLLKVAKHVTVTVDARGSLSD